MVGGPNGGRKLITVLGALNWDTTLFVRNFAAPGEEVAVLKAEEGPGGKGGNVAVAAARILGRGRVAFIGAAGADQSRGKLVRSLADEGVDAGGVISVRGAVSGRAFIVVDRDGRKAIHTSFGANDRLGSADIKGQGTQRRISRSGIVVIMDVPVGVVNAAARAASQAGARVILSPGVRCTAGLSRITEALVAADSLVVNRGELQRLCKAKSVKDALRHLVARRPGLVVVCTLGARGALVVDRGGTEEIPPFDLRKVGLRPVNSTGSGDAFLATYAVYRLDGRSPQESARWGSLAGALKSARSETRGSPTRQELEGAMASYLRGSSR
jgi:ribokinase